MQRQYTLIILLTLIAILGTACGNQNTPVPANNPLPATPIPASVSTITSTPDPCTPENIKTEIEKVHKLMREFDDASMLASSTPLAQLSPTIAELQRIRRDAEDQPIPSCLVTMKQYQLAHMNMVINTLLGFLSGADQETLNQGIALARQQHDRYTLELATLLGLTVVAPPTQEVVVTDGTPEAIATPTIAGIYVTNPGPTTVNLRVMPDLNAGTLGIMDIGASAAVLGRTADALWFQIKFPDQPGQTAWVYASLVQLSEPVELPVVTTNP